MNILVPKRDVVFVIILYSSCCLREMLFNFEIKVGDKKSCVSLFSLFNFFIYIYIKRKNIKRE